MNHREYARLFKRHYKKAMRLKEGGAAWERGIEMAHQYLELGKVAYKQYLDYKYKGY